MSSPPTGTVTFLFTDIEGSTRMWSEHPEPMRQALEVHDALVRSTVEGHGGYVFSTAGDAFSVAFADPRHALAAALQSQNLITLQEWPPPIKLRVRMALHSGVASERGGDYFGTAPSRCARVLGTAGGGQILVTEATHGMLMDHRLDGVGFRDLGMHQLRDLTSPERIFAVLHESLPEAPIRSLSTLPNNLPAQLTSFIGRHQELEEASKSFRGSRLLTVVGVGGSGKSRLALQIAADSLDEYADGVWLVELAPVIQPDQVVRTVAAVVGVPEKPDLAIEELLIDHIRHRQLLLLLDNCEHLVGEVARLVSLWLAASAGLKVLATSREMLGVPGEIPYPLRSMEVPTDDMPLSDLAHFDAVELFVSRAEAAEPGFRIDEANAATVIQLCRRLDGMPLALELAAARLRMLSVEQIAGRLDDRFRLLTGGSRTALPRQQTLQATIDWSYDLLSEEERLLFERLTVFVGGFTLEAAEQVCSDEEISPDHVLDLLGHLVDKSLVAVGESNLGRRYRLLETLRQYGWEKLAQRGVTDLVRRRHWDYFHDLVEQALPHLRGPKEEEWRDRLREEDDNLRQALRWSIDKGEVDLAQSLAGILYRYWMLSRQVLEGRSWLEEALAMGNGSLKSLGRALLGAGTLAMFYFDHDYALPRLERALPIVRQAGDEGVIFAALHNLGVALTATGARDRARPILEEELVLARAKSDRESESFALDALADLALNEGDIDTARGRFQEAADVARTYDSKLRLGDILTGTALAMLAYDDLDTAARDIEEIVELGPTSFAPGRHLVFQALLLARRGDLAAAKSHLKEGLGRFQMMPEYREFAGVLRPTLTQWAAAEAEHGSPERAATILGAVDAMPDLPFEIYEQRFFDRTAATVEAKLGPEARAQAWALGAQMNVDQLIDFCREG